MLGEVVLAAKRRCMHESRKAEVAQSQHTDRSDELVQRFNLQQACERKVTDGGNRHRDAIG